ncbi:MAG: helix-turn-helix domain-containing protein [Bradyrhizobium sp.]
MHSTEDFYRKVGERIRAKRQERGLSQESLAIAVGLKRPSLSNIEKGRQNILLHTIHDIAETLNTSVSELLPDRVAAETVEIAGLEKLPTNVRAFVEAGINPADKSGR